VHALVSHRFAGNWDASVAIHQQSAFRASGLSDPQRAFVRVDTRLATRLPLWRGGGEIAITVENLFDNHYTECPASDMVDGQFQAMTLWVSTYVTGALAECSS